MSFLLISITLLVTRVAGFGILPPTLLSPRAHHPKVLISPTLLKAIRCEEKFYQLEEMEDQETCTTELYLTKDNQVQVGQTDGPLFLKAKGTWNVKHGTNDYTMKITKTFGTGSEGRDMGEFTFDVERTYIGEMTKVGASVGITGVAHTLGPDEEGNQEVGFFNMIDGTKERDSYGKDKDGDDEEPFNVEKVAVKGHDARNTYVQSSSPAAYEQQYSQADPYEQQYAQQQQQQQQQQHPYGYEQQEDAYVDPYEQQYASQDPYEQQYAQQQYAPQDSYQEQYSQTTDPYEQQYAQEQQQQQQQGPYGYGDQNYSSEPPYEQGYADQASSYDSNYPPQEQSTYDANYDQQQGYDNQQPAYYDDPNPAFPPHTYSPQDSNEQNYSDYDSNPNQGYDPNYSDYNY